MPVTVGTLSTNRILIALIHLNLTIELQSVIMLHRTSRSINYFTSLKLYSDKRVQLTTPKGLQKLIEINLKTT